MPILKKNDGPTDDINNIRPIRISDTIANIFKKYALSKLENKHQDPETQFGFKAKSSTNHGIYPLTETIQHFKSKKKKIYICAIDASKAFDKVIRETLLKKMIGKIEPEIWRILKSSEIKFSLGGGGEYGNQKDFFLT